MYSGTGGFCGSATHSSVHIRPQLLQLGYTSSASWAYIIAAVPICFMWLRHALIRAFSRAWAKTGNRIAARIAMMAITTRSSIKVNALRFIGNANVFDESPAARVKFVGSLSEMRQSGYAVKCG